MYFTKKIVIATIVMIVVMFHCMLISCNKYLDQRTVESANESDHWKSASDGKSHLIGMYGLLRSALVDHNAHWMYGELRSGDFTVYNKQDLQALVNNELNKSHPLLQDLSNWRRFYAVINAASIFIEKAKLIMEYDKRYTTTMLKYDVAQARTIRAFAYFYLVRIWGDVPLLTSSFDNGKFLNFPKVDEKNVLKFAEQELVKAAEELPFLYGERPQSYYGENSQKWQGVLFNKITAYTVLAHIAAWQNKYIDVDSYTQIILDNYTRSNIRRNENIRPASTGDPGLTGGNGIFSSTYAFGQILNIGGSYALGEATASGHIEQLTLAKPFVMKSNPDIYVSKDTISALFEDPNDTRFGKDKFGLFRENYFNDFSNEVPLFTKVSIVRDGVANSNYSIFGSNLVFSRLEEIILLRAEAMYALRRFDESTGALNQIKLMRKTRKFAFDRSNVQLLIKEIFQERRRELMGEGWRFYDLIRLNKIVPTDPTIINMIAQKAQVWPISNSILENNSLIKQNEYWSISR